jgi:hypothetical protein
LVAAALAAAIACSGGASGGSGDPGRTVDVADFTPGLAVVPVMKVFSNFLDVFCAQRISFFGRGIGGGFCDTAKPSATTRGWPACPRSRARTPCCSSPSRRRTRRPSGSKADFAKHAPDAPLTLPAMAGYWSADMFVAALTATGRDLTVDTLLKKLNSGDISYYVPDTVAETRWPLNHATAPPCYAMSQLSQHRYQVTARLTCGSLVPMASASTPTS